MTCQYKPEPLTAHISYHRILFDHEPVAGIKRISAEVVIKFAFVILTLILPSLAAALEPDEVFHRISTLIFTSHKKGTESGTGFFYQQLGPRDPNIQGPQWRRIEKTWLVTNRHVVLPRIHKTPQEYQEFLPNSFSFHLRKKLEGGLLKWDAITLSKKELQTRARFHSNPKVDVAMIEVRDLLFDRWKQGQYLPWYPLSKENFPADKKITVTTSDDIVVIGYPRGYYDTTNLFPIVKTGIIASKWGADFQGEPYFLIDAKLFPGSSGSVVFTKPKIIEIVDGRLVYFKEKAFAFLGIFSGAPFQGRTIELETMIITEKLGFDVGIVWYARLIEEIIENGVSYIPPSPQQKK